MKACGNCVHFIRIKTFHGRRNGICDKYDYNCHSDSPYAKRCKGYKAKRYQRRTKRFNRDGVTNGSCKSSGSSEIQPG